MVNGEGVDGTMLLPVVDGRGVVVTGAVDVAATAGVRSLAGVG